MSSRNSVVSLAAHLGAPIAFSRENLQSQDASLQCHQMGGPGPVVEEQGQRTLQPALDIPFVGASYPQRHISDKQQTRPAVQGAPHDQTEHEHRKPVQISSMPSSAQLSEASGNTQSGFTDAALKRVFLELMQSNDPAVQGAVGSALKSALQQEVSSIPPPFNHSTQHVPAPATDQEHASYQTQTKWKRNSLSVVPREAYPGLPTPPLSERASSTMTNERSDGYRTMSMRSEALYRSDHAAHQQDYPAGFHARPNRPASAMDHARERLPAMGHNDNSPIMDRKEMDENWEDADEYRHDWVAPLPNSPPRHLAYQIRRSASQRQLAETLRPRAAPNHSQGARVSLPPPPRHYQYDSSGYDEDCDIAANHHYLPTRSPLRPAPTLNYDANFYSFGRVSASRRPPSRAASGSHYSGDRTNEEDEEYDDYDDSMSAPIPDISRSPPPSRHSQLEKGNRVIGFISPKRTPAAERPSTDYALSDITSELSRPSTGQVRTSLSDSHFQRARDKSRALPSGGRTRHRVKDKSNKTAPAADRRSSLIPGVTGTSNATSLLPTSLLPASISLASKDKYQKSQADHHPRSVRHGDNDPFQPNSANRAEKHITLTPEWISPNSKSNSNSDSTGKNPNAFPTTASSSNHSASRRTSISTPAVGAGVTVVFEQGNRTRTIVENASPKASSPSTMNASGRAGGGGRGGGGARFGMKNDSVNMRKDGAHDKMPREVEIGIGVFETEEEQSGRKRTAGGGGVKKFFGRMVSVLS